jgi:flagellar hook protein FlgE
MGFGQALSGLNAAATNLDVIGNNIANAGTVGFKSGTASFADVYASAAVGLGTQVASINQQFSTGTLTTTQNPFDLAIDGGKGFFRVIDSNGAIKYTRNGQFLADKDGYIVNVQGDKLTGYSLDGITLQPITVPDGNMAPAVTSSITNRINVDVNEPAITAGAFDPNNADTFNNTLPVNIYDSLGNSHQLIQYFAKDSATNTWNVYFTLDGNVLGTQTDPLDPATFAPTTTQITFSDNGQISGVDGAATTTYGLTIPVTGANDLNFTLNYANSTQYGSDFNYTFNQNGYPSGEYASMNIEPDGSIVASYTNGQTDVRGYLALADFPNVNGLKSAGGNAWEETGASGQPILGRPGTNSLSLVKSMAVEESNVDMSQELVNMIIAQRTYQANAQTIKTQDQILQTLIQMR